MRNTLSQLAQSKVRESHWVKAMSLIIYVYIYTKRIEVTSPITNSLFLFQNNSFGWFSAIKLQFAYFCKAFCAKRIVLVLFALVHLLPQIYLFDVDCSTGWSKSISSAHKQLLKYIILSTSEAQS